MVEGLVELPLKLQAAAVVVCYQILALLIMGVNHFLGLVAPIFLGNLVVV